LVYLLNSEEQHHFYSILCYYLDICFHDFATQPLYREFMP